MGRLLSNFPFALEVMASSQPSSTAQKSSSRWGSFLAGVESRLDTILADEDTRAPTRGDGPVQEQPGKKGGMVVAAPGKTGPPRSASTNTAQDRLNERLAKAMVGRSLGKKGDSSIASSGVPSRTASPTNVTLSPRTSLDLQGKPKGEQELTMNNSPSEGQEAQRDNSEAAPNGAEPMNQSPIVAIEEALNKPRGLAESHAPIAAPQPFEMTRPTSPKVSDSSKPNGVLVDTSFEAPEQYEKVIELMRSDHEIAELQRQEEMHTYLERIDALQSKLQYLTNEAADLSKKASVEAQPGSLEQMIASKDEKIALLIEEGEKLSQTELKHMGIIKKLRAKSADDDKSIIESKRAVERYEKAAKEAQERTRRIESAEKRASERLKGLGKLEKDLEAVKVDRDAKESLVQDLQFQLTQATSAAKEAEFKANSEALEAEKRHVADLTDELSKTKVEKDLAEKQHQNELRELRERAEREKERAKVAEMERQGERNILESRLEACRARVEEVSAGQGGDMQAKLLRQIETLQNQYAVASENWQGIEGSLLSRVTALEKEKDDVAKREADVRRKARETVGSNCFNPGSVLTSPRA